MREKRTIVGIYFIIYNIHTHEQLVCTIIIYRQLIISSLIDSSFLFFRCFEREEGRKTRRRRRRRRKKKEERERARERPYTLKGIT